MQSVINKRKLIIISAAAAVLLAAVIILLLFLPSARLRRAMRRLDVNDEVTVIDVMKYGSKNPQTVYEVAHRYTEHGMYEKAAVLMLYGAQYLKDENAATLLRECYGFLGADKRVTDAIDFADFTPLDFDTVTEFEGTGYGTPGSGVYVSFLGGYVKARISPMLPLGISAAKDGVYIIDASDGLAKFISFCGHRVEVKSNTRVSEILCIGDKLYTIDQNGTPSSGKALADGEYAANLREQDEKAVCTVFDSNNTALYDITL